ncbi:MAG TPA: molybdopterin-dependent oxidoreductase [Chitinophagaceae bacterium]|nr:molybdopterin-dependent oxidoreductase [Chitinophagaceae bacterium]
MIDQSPTRWSRKRFLIRSIGSFILFSVLIYGGIAGFKWLNNQPHSNGANAVLRKGLDLNEKVNRIFQSNQSLAPTYPNAEAVAHPRVNGNVGEPNSMPDTATWRLVVRNNFNSQAGADSVMRISVADLKRLPKTEYTFEFKCIEGWSQKTRWGGVRLSEFMNYYHLGTSDGSMASAVNPRTALYVGFMTIDSQYYVGIDMLSALHPQTLLCYELNGKPLPFNQGAPLRLIIPVKYGIKNIKWIGSMYFSNTRPKDYWFERGYDYDASL